MEKHSLRIVLDESTEIMRKLSLLQNLCTRKLGEITILFAYIS